MSQRRRAGPRSVDAGRDAPGELVWRLPLHHEYAELIKGRYADIVNRPSAREATPITAAEFLHRFAGDVPWAHLDIAGTAWDGGGRTRQGRTASACACWSSSRADPTSERRDELRALTTTTSCCRAPCASSRGQEIAPVAEELDRTKAFPYDIVGDSASSA